MLGDMDLSELSLVKGGIGNIGEAGTDKRNQNGQNIRHGAHLTVAGIDQRQCFHQFEEFTPVEKSQVEAVAQCVNPTGGQPKVQTHLIPTHR